MSQTKNSYLYILQIFRAVCVLIVIIHHTVPALKYFNSKELPGYDMIYEFTKYGVDFFLLISGFIIYYTHYYSTSNRTVKQYYLSRFLRIYVPFLPLSIGMLALHFILPQLSEGGRNISLITSLALVPHGSPALSVTWSLVYEVMFYFLFGLCILNRKAWHGLLLVWFTLIVVFNYIYPINYGYAIFLNPYCFNFMIGYGLSLLVIGGKKISKTVCAVGILGFLTAYLTHYFTGQDWFLHDRNLLITGVHFFLAYLCVVYYNQNYSHLKYLFFVGNISYSVYLIHNPLISFLVRVFPKEVSTSQIILLILTIVACSLVSGYFYCQLFEKKVVNYLKARLKWD